MARRGFTLIEMLAVITIIGILASALAYTVSKARSLARQADCKSNLRQLGAAVLVYRADHNSSNPPWISNLYPDYVDDQHLFVCRSDKSHGLGNCYPTELAALSTGYSASQINDNPGNTYPCATQRNPNVLACSYFYEFSVAPTPWKTLTIAGRCPSEPFILYCDYKNGQLQYGDVADGNMAYSTSRMPIIRCYNHIHEGWIRSHMRNTDGTVGPIVSTPSSTDPLYITLNVAYAGNVFVGPLWWEGSLQPGE